MTVTKTVFSSTNELFGLIFNAISKEVAYDDAWANGTGYLDGLVDADIGLVIGDVVKTTTHKGRRVIVIATPKDNIVLFERYTVPDSVIVSNTHSFFKKFGILPPGSVDAATILNLFQLMHFGDTILGEITTNNNIGSAMV